MVGLQGGQRFCVRMRIAGLILGAGERDGLHGVESV